MKNLKKKITNFISHVNYSTFLILMAVIAFSINLKKSDVSSIGYYGGETAGNG